MSSSDGSRCRGRSSSRKPAQRIDRLIDALPDRQPLVLSARAAGLPGLGDHLKRAGFEITLLAAGCGRRRLQRADLELVRTADDRSAGW